MCRRIPLNDQPHAHMYYNQALIHKVIFVSGENISPSEYILRSLSCYVRESRSVPASLRKLPFGTERKEKKETIESWTLFFFDSWTRGSFALVSFARPPADLFLLSAAAASEITVVVFLFLERRSPS